MLFATWESNFGCRRYEQAVVICLKSNSSVKWYEREEYSWEYRLSFSSAMATSKSHWNHLSPCPKRHSFPSLRCIRKLHRSQLLTYYVNCFPKKENTRKKVSKKEWRWSLIRWAVKKCFFLFWKSSTFFNPTCCESNRKTFSWLLKVSPSTCRHYSVYITGYQNFNHTNVMKTNSDTNEQIAD